MTDSDASRVKRLVESLFTLAGVEYSWADGCLSAQLSGEAMSALEGRWSNPGALLLAFEPEVVATHPEADLVAPGSFRLERFLTWIRREVGLSRVFLPALPRGAGQRHLPDYLRQMTESTPLTSYYLLEESQEWEPHLLVAFLAARVGEERRETLHLAGVNLVTGRVGLDFADSLPKASGPAGVPQARRRIPYRRAYAAAVDSLAARIRAEDGGWAAASLERYETEARQLHAYYEELARENRADADALRQLEANRERRLEEQKDRFLPRVLVRPVATALLYVPVVRFTVLLCTGLNESRRTVIYDSLAGSFRSGANRRPPNHGPARRRPPNPPPESALQPPPDVRRWPG